MLLYTQQTWPCELCKYTLMTDTYTIYRRQALGLLKPNTYGQPRHHAKNLYMESVQ